MALNFAGRTHLLEDVLRELPATSLVPRIPWYVTARLTLPEHLVLYAALRQHWGSAPGRDGGEAACIAYAAAYGLLFVTDDGVAFATASRPPASVCTLRTTGLVVAMVRVGWLSDTDAWAGLQAMLTAGRRLGPFPWTDLASFAAECAQGGLHGCHSATAVTPAPGRRGPGSA